MTAQVREHFKKRMKRGGDELVVAPLALDAMTALIAKRAGFDAVYVGGGALGYALGVSEALLSANDCVDATRRIYERLPDMALVVDVSVGFGDPVHAYRMVKMMEAAGASAIEIEDQVSPKRAHHHKGVEHLVPIEEMNGRIKACCDARLDDNFVVIARTNAPQNEDMERSMARAQAYFEAGADVVMVRARKQEEFDYVSTGTDAPLAALSSWALRPEKEMIAAGFCLVVDPNSATVLPYKALDAAFRQFRRDMTIGIPKPEIDQLLLDVRDLIDLEELYAIERETTEKDQAP